MILPAKDIEALTAVMDILCRFDPQHNRYPQSVVQQDAKDILKALEVLGYHKKTLVLEHGCRFLNDELECEKGLLLSSKRVNHE